MTGVLCILDHGKRPDGTERLKEAVVGQACANHRASLDQMLQETLEILAAGPQQISEAGERSRTKKAEYPALTDLGWLAVFDHRNSAAINPGDIPNIPGDLQEHLDRADEEHGKRGDGNPFTALPLHHDWLCEQDWLVDYRDCLKTCLAAAKRVTHQPSIMLPKEVTCAVTLKGQDCGGRTRKHEHGIKCVKCGRLWQQEDLLRLGLMLTA